MAVFSLSCETYQTNICAGLCALQQNGEFVDMTIAADGHHVKVHQMVMSLASPYIKELLTSAPCPHPVIFLNKISYSTLSSILEYIYTGEVLVGTESLIELIEACKELHINGLEDMKMDVAMELDLTQKESRPLSETGYFDKKKNDDDDDTPSIKSEFKNTKKRNTKSNTAVEIINDNESSLLNLDDTDHHTDNDMETDQDGNESLDNSCEKTSNDEEKCPTKSKTHVKESQLQYTISNQGSLQMILNRFVYYCNYTYRTKGEGGGVMRQWRCVTYGKGKAKDGSKCPAAVFTKDNIIVKRTKGEGGGVMRQWRCVTYGKGKAKDGSKCPAAVYTKDNIIVKRTGAHIHPFHDKIILKKVRDKAVFSALKEAEVVGNLKKQARHTPPIQKDDNTDAD